MNTDILSIDPIIIEVIPEEPPTLITETGTILPEVSLHVKPRFGITDLWKIRSAKRHFIYYR